MVLGVEQLRDTHQSLLLSRLSLCRRRDICLYSYFKHTPLTYSSASVVLKQGAWWMQGASSQATAAAGGDKRPDISLWTITSMMTNTTSSPRKRDNNKKEESSERLRLDNQDMVRGGAAVNKTWRRIRAAMSTVLRLLLWQLQNLHHLLSYTTTPTRKVPF